MKGLLTPPTLRQGGDAQDNDGCPTCGLMGCDCDPTEPATDRKGVCTVCKRRLPMKAEGGSCICASRVPLRTIQDRTRMKMDGVLALATMTHKQRDYAVQEGMLLYINRDAAALEKYLRQWIERATRVA